jgi:hypothetical protein
MHKRRDVNSALALSRELGVLPWWFLTRRLSASVL